ncbi:hypothetical protein QYM36_001589 [Artemia franciscana]|uniref:Amidase domain-containing protein n=1 Tax=Artemia franciscana TaxID=6661 RepID=A0AA88LBG1_ARTSF|nr:hypothetical protein QYM36_001589 [Artemia franciscana]
MFADDVALEVTATLNCVTEFIDEADELANQLDTVPKEDRKPLHGLPISLKDNVGVTGYDATVGIAKFLDSPCRADAVIVSVLKSLGAVPFCKTNIPQTMLSFGCDNPVWGQTRNPHNPSRSPGGSSGGEGSLIGGGGSIVGIGSDIGGSARIPAAFCGLASIKPTAGRISYHGFKKSIKGILGVDSVPGILAKDVDAVIGVSRHLFGNRLQSELDPLLPVIDWNEKAFTSQKKLKIGYYLEDDFVPATPGMKRAVKEAMAALEKSGHELVPFRPFDIGNVTALAIRLLQADGGHYFKEIMFGERVASVLMLTKLGVHIPNCFKKFLSFIISFVSPRIAKVFQASGGTCTNSSRELWAAVHLKDDYVRIVSDAWKREGLDLLICPAFACPAPEIGLEGRFTPCVSYTLTYNILNFPCGILPVSKESQEDQEELKQYPRDDKLLSEIAKLSQLQHNLRKCEAALPLYSAD